MKIETEQGPHSYSKIVPEIGEFYLAYRKVKTELWWAKNVICKSDLAAYESHPETLHKNLLQLREKLITFNNGEDIAAVFGKGFLGTVYDLPKGVKAKSKDPTFVDLSNDASGYDYEDESLGIRRMARPSIDFQILGMLWAMNNGAVSDASRSTASRANVLRRVDKKGIGNVGSESEDERKQRRNSGHGKINKLYPGLYRSYFSAYRNWRTDGLKVAEQVLENNKGAYLITLDIKNFYPSIDTAALRKLTPLGSTHLENVLFTALEAWEEAYGTPSSRDSIEGKKLGIPVGLIVSGLVANLVLDNLDKSIERKLNPLYYGRYVDDIFLVVESQSNIKNTDDVLAHISRRLAEVDSSEDEYDLIKRVELELVKGDAYFSSQLWEASAFQIHPDKTKCFFLQGGKGKDFLRVINESLIENGSEWRMVPDLSDAGDIFLKETLCATDRPSKDPVTLRDADSLSTRRLGVSLNLRRLESLEQYHLNKREWKSLRETFYGFSIQHVFTPHGVVDYVGELPRIFGLAFTHGDWSSALDMLKRLDEALAELAHLYYNQSLPMELDQFLCESLIEQYKSACAKTSESKVAERVLREITQLFGPIYFPEADNKQLLQEELNRYQQLDLHRKRHATTGKIEDVKSACEFLDQCQEDNDFFPAGIITKAPNKDVSAFLFPTRPLGLLEISLAIAKPSNTSNTFDREKIKLYMKACRGICYPNQKAIDEDSKHVVSITACCEPRDDIRVAVTNFQTEDKSFKDSIHGTPDRSFARLERLLGLVDQFLRHSLKEKWNERALYFVLPELSVPTDWLLPLAKVFRAAGVSLIAGGEYEYGKGKELINPAYLFLTSKDLGYPDMIALCHSKSEAAHGEAEELWRANHSYIKVRPKTRIAPEAKYYKHGNFYFGVALCSELSNAELHHHYRGHVDAVFIPQWNRDLGTFSSLIEASSYSIYAYMIQVNNRKYGDSRIRVPAKERHEQDVVRLLGGEHDYYVTGTLNIKALRDFQKDKHTNPIKFKPTPSGFNQSEYKKRLGLK